MKATLDELGVQRAVEEPGDVGVFSAVLRGLGDGHIREGGARREARRGLAVGDHRVAEVAQGEVVEVVAAAVGLQQVVGEHGVHHQALDAVAVVVEHPQVVLEVLADLGHARIGEHPREARHHQVFRELGARAVVHRHIDRGVFSPGQADPDELGVQGI